MSALAGCGRPTGDFGRAEPSVINDTLMPFAGGAIAKYGREEQVSGFNHTDREEAMRDTAWSLIMPPHVGDWITESVVELQRTRILPTMDSRFDPRAYYAFLRREQFRSSDTRWSRVISDMRTDAQLIGPFWQASRAVREDDRSRLQALDARRDLAPSELSDAYARIDENARVVDWVWRSMRLRLSAYHGAIDRLAVETPSDKRVDAMAALKDLQDAIAAAEKEGGLMAASRPVARGRSSRYLDPNSVNQPVPQK